MNILSLIFYLSTQWALYYDPSESGPLLESLMGYILDGARAVYNCSIVPSWGAFAFDSSVCWGFVSWLK